MRSKNVPSPDSKKVWSFSSLHELHIATNSLLRHAMLNERSKRWSKEEVAQRTSKQSSNMVIIKVISSYTELLWMIDLDNLPDDYEPPSVYSMLLYELYYHLGVAYQHKKDHHKAIEQFTKAIEAVSITKNGCLAGCLTNSCLMTPIYARRAFAHANLGSYKLSLKDAETAIVLDSKNPDVYCIRALVRSTFDDELMGLKDLDIALKMNPSHLCSTMLKASFTKPLFNGSVDTNMKENMEEHFFWVLTVSNNTQLADSSLLRAARIFQDASSHMNCNSFTHPCIMDFYDKFLFPLSVPHTVTVINLKPEKPSKKQLESNADIYKPNEIRTSTPSQTDVFRCGTPGITEGSRISLQRRTDYGNAIRKHMARPKSASEFFSLLEKQHKKEAMRKRAQSAVARADSRVTMSPQMASARIPTSSSINKVDSRLMSPQMASARIPTSSSVDKVDSRLMSPQMASTRVPTSTALKNDNIPSSTRQLGISQNSPSRFLSPPSRPSTHNTCVMFKEQEKKECTSKTIVIETPANYSIPIFQAVNVKFAPRMYYRPWGGDKLPVPEKQRIKYSPAFY